MQFKLPESVTSRIPDLSLFTVTNLQWTDTLQKSYFKRGRDQAVHNVELVRRTALRLTR